MHSSEHHICTKSVGEDLVVLLSQLLIEDIAYDIVCWLDTVLIVALLAS